MRLKTSSHLCTPTREVIVSVLQVPPLEPPHVGQRGGGGATQAGCGAADAGGSHGERVGAQRRGRRVIHAVIHELYMQGTTVPASSAGSTPHAVPTRAQRAHPCSARTPCRRWLPRSAPAPPPRPAAPCAKRRGQSPCGGGGAVGWKGQGANVGRLKGAEGGRQRRVGGSSGGSRGARCRPGCSTGPASCPGDSSRPGPSRSLPRRGPDAMAHVVHVPSRGAALQDWVDVQLKVGHVAVLLRRLVMGEGRVE